MIPGLGVMRSLAGEYLLPLLGKFLYFRQNTLGHFRLPSPPIPGSAEFYRKGTMLKKIYHLGYAVEDIEKAAEFYRVHFGAEPGEPEEVAEQGIKATMFEVGESMVELVEPTRPDSPVGKFLAKRGEGFHHVAFEVEDIEKSLAELKESGVELIDEEPRTGADGTRMAFVHPKEAFGVLTELVELKGK